MLSDRDKWDARYGRKDRDLPTPDEFLVAHAELLGRGRALDVACGLGANSLFLAARGFAVDSVDISFTAVRRLLTEARRQGAEVRSFVADLDHYPLPRDLYDVVLVFYFFSESLIPRLKEWVKTGGLIVYATYNHRHTSIRPEFNRAYLVPKTGLSPYFSEFEIVVPEEDTGPFRNICHLVAARR